MTEKRYPLQALVDAVGMSEAATARLIGLSGSSLKSARERGFRELAADRYACRAGLVPWLIWSDWLDELEVECAAEGCGVRFVPSRKGHRCCSDRCSKLHHKRVRYQTDPAFAEDERRKRRAYYAECIDYERAMSRARHAANRERATARMRAYYQENAEVLREKQRARHAAKRGQGVAA